MYKYTKLFLKQKYSKNRRYTTRYTYKMKYES